VHLRRPARHEEIDRAFRFRRKVWQAESVAPLRRWRFDVSTVSIAPQAHFTEQSRQRGPPQRLAGPPEEAPPRLDRSPLLLNRRRDGKVQRSHGIFAVGAKWMLLHISPRLFVNGLIEIQHYTGNHSPSGQLRLRNGRITFHLANL